MTGFVVILTALQLAVPVHCYTDQQAYDARAKQLGVVKNSIAYYNPLTAIALSPRACKDVLAPNLEGADTLAHELAHHWQYVNTHSMNEAEAVKIAYWSRRTWLRRLERVLSRRAKPVPKPDIVILKAHP